MSCSATTHGNWPVAANSCTRLQGDGLAWIPPAAGQRGDSSPGAPGPVLAHCLSLPFDGSPPCCCCPGLWPRLGLMPASPRLPRPWGRAGGLAAVHEVRPCHLSCLTLGWHSGMGLHSAPAGQGAGAGEPGPLCLCPPVGRGLLGASRQGRRETQWAYSHLPPLSTSLILMHPSCSIAPLLIPHCSPLSTPMLPWSQAAAGCGHRLFSELTAAARALRPCWQSHTVEGAFGGACCTLAHPERIPAARPLLPWALLGGLSLGQRVLPGASFLPTLVPLEGRRKGSRRRCCLRGIYKEPEGPQSALGWWSGSLGGNRRCHRGTTRLQRPAARLSCSEVLVEQEVPSQLMKSQACL